MDSTGPIAPPRSEGEGPKDWVADFRRQTDEIRSAAAEWAVRWDEPEGRFISALLGAVEIVGKLTASVQERLSRHPGKGMRRPRRTFGGPKNCTGRRNSP